MTEEKILIKHPRGRGGKSISKQKYDMFRGAILSVLRNKELTRTQLFSAVAKKWKGKFSGNVTWYGEWVKLDLGARKLIERTATTPRKYRLA
jgi:hypothetical protein